MPSTPETRGQIVVRGARTHNLKNVDLTLPPRPLVVMTGGSGAGAGWPAVPPHHQPEERGPGASPPLAGGDDGGQRLGEVVAGVRHHLRGRAAPLRGIAV